MELVNPNHYYVVLAARPACRSMSGPNDPSIQATLPQNIAKRGMSEQAASALRP
jgi:hypothetical protein